MSAAQLVETVLAVATSQMSKDSLIELIRAHVETIEDAP
jgi:hypothetical protein